MDTLVEITEAGRTSFVDTSLVPDTAYEYRVSVINAGGFEVASQKQIIPGYVIRPVELLDAALSR